MDKRVEANHLVRESICGALILLMHKKPFKQITVTDITRKAGVARASYYRNFNSKEDVMREYVSSVIDEFYVDYGAPADKESYENILHICLYFDKYRETYMLLTKAGLSTLLLEVLSSLNNYPWADSPDEEAKYYFIAFIGAIHNMIHEWLDGCRRETPEEMARIIYRVWHNRP